MPRLSVDIGLCLNRELSDCRRLHRFDVHRPPADPSAKTVAFFTRGLRRSGRWTGSPRHQLARHRTGIRLRLPPGEGDLDAAGDEHRGGEFQEVNLADVSLGLNATALWSPRPWQRRDSPRPCPRYLVSIMPRNGTGFSCAAIKVWLLKFDYNAHERQASIFRWSLLLERYRHPEKRKRKASMYIGSGG